MTPIRIFIVDDSQVIRTIIGRVLATSPDLELVGSSHCAETARAAIAALKPDVITLDIAMPGVGGFRYLDELRAIAHPAIVVVSASATPGSRSAEKALQGGAAACFDKARIVADAEHFVATLKMAAETGGSTRV